MDSLNKGSIASKGFGNSMVALDNGYGIFVPIPKCTLPLLVFRRTNYWTLLRMEEISIHLSAVLLFFYTVLPSALLTFYCLPKFSIDLELYHV